MHIRFLGGANEVGASSMPITIEGQSILVDEGIRMNATPDKQLPDFSQLGKIGAVLLTHAHTDHTGALPILMRDYLPKDMKVYCTTATKAITQVLLEDNAERLEREKKENKPPQYTRDNVTSALSCMEQVPLCQPIPICGEALTATWIPAGHILGAAMIYIKGKRESILITGDVSVTNQLSIPSIADKLPYQPDVMVMESTYGDRQHTDRAEQEAKLVQDVANMISAGGKVLIPVFAVGRAQEVILILKRAMERGRIPKFPVYVDGMVRKVNEIYERFHHELPPDLQNRAKSGEDLFYSDNIKKIESKDERSSILSGKPCCIIASSGMLKGGISSYYAEQLTRGPKNLIAITGYQAKGTPGDALLKAKESQEQIWTLSDEKSVPVKCKVERYQLSAHADGDQLTQLVEQVQPRKLFLVHGEGKARNGLKKSIQKTFPVVHVELPQNGVPPYHETKRGGIAEERCLSLDRILREVFDFVRKVGLQGPFRVRELAEMWFGTDETTPTRVRLFQQFLSLGLQDFFVPDSQCCGLFHLKRIA